MRQFYRASFVLASALLAFQWFASAIYLSMTDASIFQILGALFLAVVFNQVMMHHIRAYKAAQVASAQEDDQAVEEPVTVKCPPHQWKYDPDTNRTTCDRCGRGPRL